MKFINDKLVTTNRETNEEISYLASSELKQRESLEDITASEVTQRPNGRSSQEMLC